mgnify:CR=1 FL=1|jgi:hypothetical protein
MRTAATAARREDLDIIILLQDHGRETTMQACAEAARAGHSPHPQTAEGEWMSMA